MRPVLMVDLGCAGRAVLAAAPERQAETARALVAQAEIADLFCRDSGRAHPVYGDGTLASAARKAELVAEPTVCDPLYARALMLVLHALVTRATPD